MNKAEVSEQHLLLDTSASPLSQLNCICIMQAFIHSIPSPSLLWDTPRDNANFQPFPLPVLFSASHSLLTKLQLFICSHQVFLSSSPSPFGQKFRGKELIIHSRVWATLLENMYGPTFARADRVLSSYAGAICQSVPSMQQHWDCGRTCGFQASELSQCWATPRSHRVAYLADSDKRETFPCSKDRISRSKACGDEEHEGKGTKRPKLITL